MNLENLTRDQLRRMVDLLHESGQRMLDAYGLLHAGAIIDSHGPMNVGIGLRTDAERIAHEPHEPDPDVKALADRRTVEEWVSREWARNEQIRNTGLPGAQQWRIALLDATESMFAAYGPSSDLAYAAAAEWARGQP